METSQETAGETGNCCDWQKSVSDFEHRTQEFVREEPTKAIGVAFVAGIMLTILPMGRLIAALVRLALLLARPMLLVFGAFKLFEQLDKRNHRSTL